MAENKYPLSQLGFKSIEEQIKEAQAKNDVDEVRRLNFSAGIQSALVGTATGLPDLGIEVYNMASGGDMKTFRQLLLKEVGTPTEASSDAYTHVYGVPEYAAIALGLKQLVMSGARKIKDVVKTSKFNRLLKELEAETGPQTTNTFKQFMVTGQGADNPRVYAALDRIKANPKYAELFNTLDKEATRVALKGMAPRASKQSTEEATKGVVRAVSDKINSVREARNTAGNVAFTKALSLAGDRPIVNPKTTVDAITNLRAQYAKVGTAEADRVVSALDDMLDIFAPRINVPGSKGTSVVRQGTPDRLIPGAQVREVTEQIPVVKYDSMGMPRTVMETRTRTVPATSGTTVAGEAPVEMNIPGSAGYTTRASTRNISAPQLQGLLHEFGKKIGTDDAILKGLSQSDLDKINKTIFSSLSTDLSNSVKLASDVGDRQALGYLISARTQFQKASGEYNKLISQGIPKFLQDKPIDSVSFEDLTKAYEGLNQGQRKVFREWVGNTRSESLQAIDNQMFKNFLSNGYGKLPDGTYGFDLGKLAGSWAELKVKDPNKAAMLSDSLGVSATEFNKRMQDALVYTRKWKVGQQPFGESAAVEFARRELPVVVGSIPAFGYPGAKATQLVVDAASTSMSKFPDDLIAKALLTDEGAAFLRQAALSPSSKETLDAMTKLYQTVPNSKTFTALNQVAQGFKVPEEPEKAPDEVVIPDNLFIPDMGVEQQTTPVQQDKQDSVIPEANDIFIPSGL